MNTYHKAHCFFSGAHDKILHHTGGTDLIHLCHISASEANHFHIYVLMVKTHKGVMSQMNSPETWALESCKVCKDAVVHITSKLLEFSSIYQHLRIKINNNEKWLCLHSCASGLDQFMEWFKLSKTFKCFVGFLGFFVTANIKQEFILSRLLVL